MTNKDLAIKILDLFEDVLAAHGIQVPDVERANDPDEACIYGETYYMLEDKIAELIKENRQSLTNELTEDGLEKYKEFLKAEIKKHCNDEGYCEIYWDYNDELSEDVILKAYKNYKDDGYENVRQYLEYYLYELNIGYDDRFFNDIVKDIKESKDQDIIDAFDVEDDLRETLGELGYKGIDVNLDDLLGNTRIDVNIMFATKAEKNSDMSNIVSSFGNDYQNPFSDFNTTSEDFDNALTYLIHQQGHTTKEIFECMFSNQRGFSDDNKLSFVQSVVNELVNNSSEGCSELTALITLSGGDIIDFFNEIEKEQYLSFDTNTDIGIFNEWAGCGGLLEIELEKPFVIPTNMIRNIQIEGTKNSGYSVNSVYGLCGDSWKETLTYTDEAPSLTEEDMEQTVLAIQKMVDTLEKE